LGRTQIRDAPSELGDFVHPIFHNSGWGVWDERRGVVSVCRRRFGRRDRGGGVTRGRRWFGWRRDRSIG
jgi:hypothetical protein